MKRKTVAFFALILSVSLFLTSCGNSEKKLTFFDGYKLPDSLSTIKTGVVAENERMELSWDLEYNCVLLRDKNTSAIWSTIPYDFYSSGADGSGYQTDGVCSGLYLTYVDAENDTEVEVKSNAAVSYITARKNDNGIMLTYYFDQIGVSVPVSFILEEDGVSVSLEISKITEGDNKIVKVALMPFFASVKNNESSYLFVPSGSGAIMYTDDSLREVRSYSEPVYGSDASEQSIYKDTGSEDVRMPIFGVKNEKSGMFAIITDGAELATVQASAGDAQYGYSAVYPVFRLRGSADSYITDFNNLNNKISKYAEGIVSASRSTVRYFVLSEENSDYNGMAACYRRWLTENEELKSGVSTPDVMLTVYGGFKERKLALGVPYYTLSSLTDFEQAQNILDDITSKTSASLAVNLKGFGDSGLDYGKIGGGFTAAKVFGGEKGLKALENWCSEKAIDMFMDFDLVFITDSFSDFSVRNAAITANGVRAKFSYYSTVTREKLSSNTAYLANRYQLALSANQIAKDIKDLGITGAGISTLTSVTYSDYNSSDYYCKAHMSDDVVRMIKALNKQNLKTCGKSANAYAAARLDYVFDSPTGSSKYYSLDEEIPFYQMVFKGSVGISGGNINHASNSETEFLKTVSTGSSLAFGVCDTYNEYLLGSEHTAIAASVYSDISTQIIEKIKVAQPLINKVSSACIVSWEKKNDISKTVFDNGVTVYVNFGETVAQTELGSIEPRSFIFE